MFRYLFCVPLFVLVACGPAIAPAAADDKKHNNYDDDTLPDHSRHPFPWPVEFRKSLDEHLKDGKIGLVIVHAANNAAMTWVEYNKMIGMGCLGFITTLCRGTEWAATGHVSLPIPQDFPTADKTSVIPEK